MCGDRVRAVVPVPLPSSRTVVVGVRRVMVFVRVRW